jgi:hypothetical protein
MGRRCPGGESIHVPRSKDAPRRRDCGWSKAVGSGANTEPRGELKAPQGARKKSRVQTGQGNLLVPTRPCARNEALEWGHFRGEGVETQFTPDVAWGERGRFTPLATEPRAVRLEGIDAVSSPAVRAAEFNSRMVDFYTSRDATEMMAFVLDCHPEVSKIRQLNPGLSAVKDLPDIQYFSLSDSMKQPSHEAHSTRRVDPGAAADLEAMPTSKQPTRAFSLEETSREARDNWRRNYYDCGATITTRG